MRTLSLMQNMEKRAISCIAEGSPWRFPGALILYKSLRKDLGNNSIRIKCKGSRMYVYPYDEVVSASLILNGLLEYEKYQSRLMEEAVKPGMTVFDVGANIGYYTLLMARKLRGSGRIFAIEPAASNFLLLNANVRANGYTNVHLSKYAIRDSEGDENLFLDAKNSGAHSLALENVSDLAEKERVHTTTLDRFARNLGKIDIIKMDIQGSEASAVKGGENTLKQYNPLLFLEMSPAALENAGGDPKCMIETLESMGYHIQIIDEVRERLEEYTLEKVLTRCKTASEYVNILARKSLKT